MNISTDEIANNLKTKYANIRKFIPSALAFVVGCVITSSTWYVYDNCTCSGFSPTAECEQIAYPRARVGLDGFNWRVVNRKISKFILTTANSPSPIVVPRHRVAFIDVYYVTGIKYDIPTDTNLNRSNQTYVGN